MDVIKKIYYRIEFEITSAMAVGSGENVYSDQDIIRDSAGDPYIPGSTLAGIYRRALGREDAIRYLGDELKEGRIVRDVRGESEKKEREEEKSKKEDREAVESEKEERIRESKVLVYDAKLKRDGKPQDYRTGIRDCVGLDEWKTARKGCKFDFEIVEPGAVFVTYMEQNCEPGDGDIGASLAVLWKENQFRIGHKTMRGLGTVKCSAIYRRAFWMRDHQDAKSQMDEWLDFDMYEDKAWDGNAWRCGDKACGEVLQKGEARVWCGYERKSEDEACEKTGREIGAKGYEGNGQKCEDRACEENVRQCVLHVKLKQKGGLSVRRYTTEIGDKDGQAAADYEQIGYRRKGDKGDDYVPFIPGTTWAGAFRHHMETLIPGVTGEYFGLSEKDSVTGKMIKKKSEIWFGESEIRKSKSKLLTRTAIDRFTGGVVRNALFTERTCYGGELDLEIGFPRSVREEFRQAMAASLVDLHMGILSVGGQTSIGRGVFAIEKLIVNGEEISVSEEMYEEIVEKMRGTAHE